MSLSTSQTENIWPGVLALEPLFIDADEISQLENTYGDKALASHKDSINVLGRLEVPGIRVNIPEQKLKMIRTETSYIIETDTANCLKFCIELPQEIEGQENQIRRFHLAPSDNSVEAGILFTRTAFALIKTRHGSLYLEGISAPFRFNINHLSELQMRSLLYRAKVLRKLQYIEDILKVKFALPNLISSEEVEKIEMVFRGMTEGEFSTRSKDKIFRISSQDIDLNRPPYFGPGQFDASIGDKVALFGQQLVVGPMTIHIEKAELANHKVVDLTCDGSNKFIDVRFAVLDNQIKFYFQDYARIAKEDLIKPLEQFKQRLMTEEPKELADSIADFLANDVSSFEALQIAVGWTQYHDLPDRYCPQEPELDNGLGHWRVPVYLVYTNGEGGPVGEIVIDVKTGVIISHTPIEELRSKGRALAEQILHA